MDAGLIAPVVIAAALVIRTAIAELRAPGTTRATWAFTPGPRGPAPRRPHLARHVKGTPVNPRANTPTE
ncbi:nitronate monooxygenase, partial [Streptomyces sp. NPDC001795]